MKKSKPMKKFLVFMLLLVSALLAAGCGAGNSTGDTQVNERLVIATMPSVDKVPMLVAQEKGFFAQHGLDVEIQNFQSPVDRDAALQAGQVDGIMSDMVAAALYWEAGAQLTMTSQVQTVFGILASPASGLKSLKDVAPENIWGLSLNGLIEYVADKAGAQNKVLLPDVSARVEQLLAGEIALTVIPEPYATLAVQRGAVLLATSEDLGINAAVMLFNNDLLKEKPEAVQAFYDGYAEAVDYLSKADPADYMDQVIADGEYPANAAEAISAMKFTRLQAPDEAQFENVLTWMRAKEDFSGNYQFAFTAVTDASFVNAGK